MNRDMEEVLKRITRLEQELARLVKPEVPKGYRDWTPTITQSGSVTITINYARYVLHGKLAHVQFNVETTAAGTTGNAIVIGGQPANIQPAQLGGVFPVLGIFLIENGTTRYTGAVYAVTATEWRMWKSGDSGNSPVGQTFALASGDEISIDAIFERA